MFDFLNYEFMIYALVIGLAIGVSSALLSPFLVLNHQAMIADGLSHVAFTGIIFGLLLSDQPIWFAIPFCIVASILITFLSQIKMIDKDSAIGVISLFSLAVGLITVSLTDGFSRSIESLLVGSILTVSKGEVIIAIVLFVVIAVFITMFYRSLLSSTYDPTYAKFNGVKNQLLKYALSVASAVVIVIGVRSVGMLLISAFIIFPALIASQISVSFKQTLLYSMILALLTVFIGLTISYHVDLPTGSTIVVIYSVLLVAAIIFRKLFRRV